MRRRLAFLAEIVFISALILVTRCANYGDVFFGGQINFIDADCYSRMTRARIRNFSAHDRASRLLDRGARYRADTIE